MTKHGKGPPSEGLSFLRPVVIVSMLCMLYYAPASMADAIVRNQAMFADTIAEYFVEDEYVRLELEIGSSDIGAFRNLLPDALYQRLDFGNMPLAERLATFLREDIPVYVGDSRLAGSISSIGPGTRPLRDDVTGEALPTPEAEAIVVIRATLIFPFDQRPDSLTLVAPQQTGLANIDTSATSKDRLIPLEDSVLHQHGPEGEHSHQGTAFTTWLDPELAVAQAEVLAGALSELAPVAEPQFRNNLAKLVQDLMQLDAELARVFGRLDGQPVLFSHPVYQYLERRFGINGASVHWEPDQGPSTATWIELQQILTTHRATVMIWEDQPLDETATRLTKANVESIAFHTGANRPDDGDYLSIMYDNIRRLE